MCWNALTHSVTLDPSFRLDGYLVGGEVGIRPIGKAFLAFCSF
jgi:hypothetical protein